ncbi:MAG TPA: hypothetical protein VFI29_15155 [Hanamia sp.]|nr:hypothetical protein [Hanamia sp.]
MAKNYDELPFYDKLKGKIHAYYQTIWREKWKEETDQAEDWLKNFSDGGDDENIEKERINMLYLLSKFMYFGNDELRQLLISLYRDLFKYPIVAAIRLANGNTLDTALINTEFQKELSATRFLGVGNPSESGVHMLYYFRQECQRFEHHFKKCYFINTSDIFTTNKITEDLPDGKPRTYLKSEITDKLIKRYVFIDDFCGSGSQATSYLKNIVKNIKFENKDIEVNYLMLFGTENGINAVRNLKVFNKVEAVFTIDDTFKAFSNDSRYYKILPDDVIDKDFSKLTASKYGINLFNPPLGYGNCELLLGLYHNTPDNSLPIFWSEQNEWEPIFKRYHKIY